MYVLHVRDDNSKEFSIKMQSEDIKEFDEICEILDEKLTQWYFEKDSKMWYGKMCENYLRIVRSTEGKAFNF